MDYNVISPNLTRRPDRWTVFYDTLISQGVPPERIIRFPSHDGRDYMDTALAMQHASQLHNGNPPRYLATGGGLDKFNWCWNWSWYDCIARIAEANEPCMFLVDDFKVNFKYDEITRHLDALDSLSVNPLLIVQYGGAGKTSKYRCVHEDIELPDCPKFQNGLTGAWDICSVYTPAGARWFIDFIENHERHERPCHYHYEVELHEDKPAGMYGPSSTTDAWGDWIARLPTAEASAYQDRQTIEHYAKLETHEIPPKLYHSES